ncbi:hypothetical protein [Acrocarpospora corrugata]|uniref:hypothetical protein n=1 Tax=Acrocarpospora corrugata TaxID=35763 RepID=UPI0012D2E2A7|nr:hypothetical protein [Acrocarpospora corrugata]
MTRYRFWVVGVLLAGGYALIFAATTAYLNLVGDDLPMWLIAQTWYAPFDDPAIFAVPRLVTAALTVWGLWQISRGPTKDTLPLRSPRRTGGVDGLRRTLYELPLGCS